MPEKKLKVKDMMIAIFCTLLAILCIVFYFLPAFNVKHRIDSYEEYKTITYSGWQMTQVIFQKQRIIGGTFESLQQIKQDFGFPLITGGLIMPIAIICVIATTVFAYLSWFKGEKFKKFCFLFSLCGMMFQTFALICTWFIALQVKDSNIRGNIVGADMKGGISYAAFVSLILTFVVAIIACAYNYFLDNFNDDDEDEDEDEEYDDDEEEVVIVRRKKKKIIYVDEDEDEEEEVKPTKKTAPTSVQKESTGGEKFVKVETVSKSNKSTTAKK